MAFTKRNAMGVQLHQLKFFTDLQGSLEALTAADLAATLPGDAVPEGAKIAGKMSPALKAMLCLRQKSSHAAEDAEIAYRRARNTDSRTELETKALKLQQQNKVMEAMFWAAVHAEFPKPDKMNATGYGPDFQVYFENKDTEEPDLGAALGGLIMTGIIRR